MRLVILLLSTVFITACGGGEYIEPKTTPTELEKKT
jgi:hypothetical protein